MYPQSLATFRAARTSFADPQAVENRDQLSHDLSCPVVNVRFFQTQSKDKR
jgi:hypothetical protein